MWRREGRTLACVLEPTMPAHTSNLTLAQSASPLSSLCAVNVLFISPDAAVPMHPPDKQPKGGTVLNVQQRLQVCLAEVLSNDLWQAGSEGPEGAGLLQGQSSGSGVFWLPL